MQRWTGPHWQFPPNPIGDARLLIEQNDALVDALDEPTKDLIRRNTDAAYEKMGPTSMYRAFSRWHRALDRIAPQVLDAKLRDQALAMLEVLELHQQQGC